MKKCMIAAIAAVVAGGAFAACTLPTPTPATADTWAYTWKFSGKTTAGVKIAGTKDSSGSCGLTTPGTAGGAVRVPASLKIQGYTAYCDVLCGSDDFEVLDESQEIFYQTKPSKVSLAGGVNIDVSNIIGKKAKQYEVAGTAVLAGFVDEDSSAPQDAVAYNLTFAGLGKYDLKNSRVSSASGNFAGYLEYPWYVSKAECLYAQIWDCATITLVEDPVTSVAFGKWNVKYNKKAAKKLDGKGNIAFAASVPKWVIPYNYLATAAQ